MTRQKNSQNTPGVVWRTYLMVEHAGGQAQGGVGARSHGIAVPVRPAEAERKRARACVACLPGVAPCCCHAQNDQSIQSILSTLNLDLTAAWGTPGRQVASAARPVSLACQGSLTLSRKWVFRSSAGLYKNVPQQADAKAMCVTSVYKNLTSWLHALHAYTSWLVGLKQRIWQGRQCVRLLAPRHYDRATPSYGAIRSAGTALQQRNSDAPARPAARCPRCSAPCPARPAPPRGPARQSHWFNCTQFKQALHGAHLELI